MTTPSDGFVVPVDKPVGPTSHDVVVAARRALGVRRVGHTGTLDPFASGLLLLCVGGATRLAEYLTDMDKTYIATARLGQRTETDDREGDIIEERLGWEGLEVERVAAALSDFLGPIQQVPPQYSAKKISGVAMHRRARRGEVVALEARPVTIHDIELMLLELPLVRFKVRCSSGTYVRSLARDLGEALGLGAHLLDLRRTRIGSFGVECALTLQELTEPGRVREAAIAPMGAVEHLGVVELGVEQVGRLMHGQAIPNPGPLPDGLVAASHLGELVAVCLVADGTLRPKKVLRA